MRPSRIILGLLLAYQALFLNVLLPGHTRGAITLDGKHAATAGCCCGDAPCPADRPRNAPSERDRRQCAVCQFAAGLTPVAVVRFTLPDLGLLARVPDPPPVAVVSLDPAPTYLACGPPPSPAHL